MIKVLIADDSMLTRVVLRDLLSRDPEISVVGEVKDGKSAIEETCRLRPDLIIMDVMMPIMDGLTATMEIMACCPTPILVLSANVDPKDSRSAFNAIKHGALDVMEKPQGILTEAFEEIAENLLAKIKFLARIRVIHHFRRVRPISPPKPIQKLDGPRDILAVGASTGGPKAVMRLLKEIPPSLDIRVLVVQHIAKGFATGFADWLARECPMAVRLAKDGDELQRGVALVAPNDQHLMVEEGRVRLSDAPPVNCCRPSVDVLFESLARDGLAPRTAAVLLTGMGKDGGEGMARLAEEGSVNIVQDESTSAVFGMPRAAIDAGGAHHILPLADIPSTVLNLFKG